MERIGTHRIEYFDPRETERFSSLTVPKLLQPRLKQPDERALDWWVNLLETLGVFSAFSRERGSSDKPQLVRAGLPLTTGNLSGVWDRTLAVSAELAAPTRWLFIPPNSHQIWSQEEKSSVPKLSLLQALVSEYDTSIHRRCLNYIRVVKYSLSLGRCVKRPKGIIITS